MVCGRWGLSHGMEWYDQSSQSVAFARSETQQSSAIYPVQPDGENKYNIHKMCPYVNNV